MTGTIKDKELVEQLKAGSTVAFKELFDRYHTKAYALAMKVSKSAEDSEEIVQEAFINVFRKINTFEGKSAFSSWLYRITFNTALMKLRKRKKHLSTPLQDQYIGHNRNQKIARYFNQPDCDPRYGIKKEMREKLIAAIADLPADYQTIFILRDIDGLSNQAVSEIVNVSVPAVKSRLHRARVMLKKTLRLYYQDFCDDKTIYTKQKLAA